MVHRDKREQTQLLNIYFDSELNVHENITHAHIKIKSTVVFSLVPSLENSQKKSQVVKVEIRT